MNIIFFTDTDISPYIGGIERVTINLAKQLGTKGHQCFLGYFKECVTEPAQHCFQNKFKIEPKNISQQLNRLLITNNIQTCVINIASKKILCYFNKILYDVSRELNIKVIYGFYNIPGFELNGINCSLGTYRLLHGNINSNTINGIIAHFFKKLHFDGLLKRKIAQKLKWGLYADEIVLLSERYIPLYLNYIGNHSQVKFRAIGNPLSYSENIDLSKIKNKEKMVVQVARCDDFFKRQTTALRIWKEIESSHKYDDWKFVMVGYGQDENYIKRTAERLQLHNFEFQGRQNPRELLTKASVYLMTSAFEGLPMIVLDAQQFGVVPIAYNSFASIYDIIENGHNGLIIPNDQTGEYVRKLMWLMDHSAEREAMAVRGLESCRRFSNEKIVRAWERAVGGERK